MTRQATPGPRPQPVVDRPEELTAAWLSDALGRDVRAATSTRIGTGQTGAAYRLELDVDGSPSTLVAKLGAGDADARRRVRVGYRNEVGFYADLVGTVDVRCPRCWYAAIADDGLTFTLLLEDLAPRVPGIQVAGCSVAQATAAVRNLAGLHAPRWGDESLFDSRLLRRADEEGARFLGELMATATGAFVEHYGAELSPADADTLQAAAGAMPLWLLARPEPFTLLHGDYRLDNLLFPPDDGGDVDQVVDDVDDVVAVDWQTLAAGPPARDLAYFLGTSLRADDRRRSESALVATYHSALVARGVEGYDLDRCAADYRLGLLQGPMVTMLGWQFGTAVRDPSADAMFLAMARRSGAAIRENHSLAEL